MSAVRQATLRIGVDLDNTIVCYDDVFRRLAAERGLPPGVAAASKESVRQHLCRCGMEEVWTEMQGEAYGARMCEATLFPGVTEFLRACASQGRAVVVVSHRTALPIRGDAHDLHATARQWLARAGILEPFGSGGDCVFLETTRSHKLRRIATLQLDYFVDDLADLLVDPGFPARTIGVHFSPDADLASPAGLRRAHSWRDVQQLILAQP